MPFSTKGRVFVTINIHDITRPPSHEVIWDFLVGPLTELFIRLSNFVLYFRMPYDRTIWTKLYDPWFYVGTYVAANPDILIRGSFFTFFLISILRDREEFQVMKFILGLKGTQFISGVIKAILGFEGFWQCLTLELDPLACQSQGPSVGKPVFTQLVLVLWTQVRWIGHQSSVISNSNQYSRSQVRWIGAASGTSPPHAPPLPRAGALTCYTRCACYTSHRRHAEVWPEHAVS